METACDLIKSKFQFEHFSGKTKVSVLQDFYATIYLANLNRPILKLRDIFLCLIMESDADLRGTMLEKLITSIARYPVPVVPDRSPNRKHPRKKSFHMVRKSVA